MLRHGEDRVPEASSQKQKKKKKTAPDTYRPSKTVSYKLSWQKDRVFKTFFFSACCHFKLLNVLLQVLCHLAFRLIDVAAIPSPRLLSTS